MAGKKHSGGWFWKILFVLALGVFCFSAFQIYTIYRGYKIGVDEYQAVSDQVLTRDREELVLKDGKINEDGTAGSLTAELPDYNPPKVDFAKLQADNPDVVGWLEVEGVPSISYPIVQGTDNDYYLHRTFQRTSNFAGSIFMDSANAGNFSDCNTIIYGHNMKNGSMFGKLKFLYEKELYRKSRYLWICTPQANYRYEIFSLQHAPVNSETYTLFPERGEEFTSYIQKMKKKSLVDLKTQNLTGDEYVITLSTCTSNENVRFVVQARWIATYE